MFLSPPLLGLFPPGNKMEYVLYSLLGPLLYVCFAAQILWLIDQLIDRSIGWLIDSFIVSDFHRRSLLNTSFLLRKRVVCWNFLPLVWGFQSTVLQMKLGYLDAKSLSWEVNFSPGLCLILPFCDNEAGVLEATIVLWRMLWVALDRGDRAGFT